MENHNLLIDTGKDGTHCILFKNKYALSQEEVEEKFSQYGSVCNVRFHGDSTGICFVRYRFMEDAINAVENLKDDPKIRLLEHNSKKQRNRYNSEASQGPDRERSECSGTQFNQQFSRQSNQKHNMSGKNRHDNYKENEQRGNFNNDLPWGSDTNGHQKQNDVPWGSKSPTGNFKQNMSWGSNSSNKWQKQSGTVQKSSSLYPESSNLRSPKSRSNYEENDDGMPNLIDHNRKAMIEIQSQENEVPELVTTNGKILKTDSPMEKVILAEDVIVANIPPQFGAPYILHLLDRFEPLAITQIMVEPKTGKRYCHVYFKSIEESQEVETAFDKKSLLDQKLVVVRSSRLVEAAYFK